MECQSQTAAAAAAATETTKVGQKRAKPTKEVRKRNKPSKVSVVRIKYTDPDATDDSSSDETTSSSPKQIIYEVHYNKTTTNSKYPGARLRKWGNWCAEIRNPITKKRQWLGTFSTAQEASKVYLEKKKEFGTVVLVLKVNF
ncbi:AP2/ERF domain-containing protein [Heracleum sosnowskyi]|uniref:AP2/ERF domain-containing protein n=1 Tax=Heracleum sosnowskyi TaxID=360622 RepID=A0AAD8HPE4_9APIA|nr:AP2/ERF domain-containing protein [Heracleum sosnowskyi]